MTLLAEPKTITIEEFEALPDSKGYELIDGVITEKESMGALSDTVAAEIVACLVVFSKLHAPGRVFLQDTIYRCFGTPNTGRKADVSFIRKGRLPGERVPEGYINIPADLAVEVISPNDLAYDVEAKTVLYLRHGFGEVWLVYPNVRTVHVCRKDEPRLIFGANQTLTGRGPLEGFSCPVASLFPPPAPEE